MYLLYYRQHIQTHDLFDEERDMEMSVKYPKLDKLTCSECNLWSDPKEGYNRDEGCLIDSSGVCSNYSRNMRTCVKYVNKNRTTEERKYD